jgi:hypothetical protein
MKKLILITLSVCLSSLILFSQTTSNETFPRKQAVYFEGIGSYGMYSINYEYKFTLSDNLRLATGVGTSYLSQPNFLLIGVPANLIFGKKHSFETGINPIYIFGDTSKGDLRGIGKNLALSLRAGYRYESHSGFLFRIAFTPFLDTDKPISLYPSGGISVGYCF